MYQVGNVNLVVVGVSKKKKRKKAEELFIHQDQGRLCIERNETLCFCCHSFASVSVLTVRISIKHSFL
jgi:hypothetical protein